MTDTQPTSILGSMRASGLRGRGPVYRWLNKHHRAIARGFEKTESTWEGVIDAMVAAGVTNRVGGRPSANSVLKVWQRVCEDRAQRERQAKRRQGTRTRAAGSYQPPVSKAKRTTASALVPAREQADVRQLNRSATAAGEATNASIDDADDPLAVVRRQMAYIDRHIVRSPTED